MMAAKETQTKYLLAKAAMMGEVKYLRKNMQMEQGARYRYAGEGAAIRLLRPAMLKHMITCAPVATRMIHRESVPTQKGGTSHYTILEVTWRFSHAPSGEYEDVVTIGEAADSGDKSCNKAMTAAKKYALLQTFLVETGDDPDDVASKDHERRGAPPGVAQNATPTQPPTLIEEWVATVKAANAHRKGAGLKPADSIVVAEALNLREWKIDGFRSWGELLEALGEDRFRQLMRAMDQYPTKFEKEARPAEEKAA